MNIKHILSFLLVFSQTGLYAQYGEQFDNRGFEQWTSRRSVSEPTHWHSGGTATGFFSSFVSSQIEASTQTRPGSSGSKSVRLYPTKVLGVTANGNMTNGRMNAGSMSVTGSGNYNYTQRSSDAFNTPLTMVPDSLTIWVCFRSESSTQIADARAAVHGNADYKFVADGTEEPMEQLVATARQGFTRTAPSNGGMTWRRLSIPFEKNGPCNDPRYVLFTIATNIVPGEGSDNDDLFVDDLLLVYNPSLHMEQLEKYHYESGERISIPFTLNGSMSADNLNASPNQVIAQLSDSDGCFDNPFELGRITTNESGTITATIPDFTPTARYKVRIVSTNYPMVGDNIQEIEFGDSYGADDHETPRCNIFPNPTQSFLNVQSSTDINELRIIDLTGITLIQESLPGMRDATLDVSYLRPGIYFLQIKTSNGVSLHQIIKL